MAEKHQKKKKGSALKILLTVLLLLVLTAGAAGVFAYNEINGNGGKPGAEVTVSIPQGSGVAAIARELKEAGVIRSAYLFRWYVGHKGAAGKLQYGDFTLQTGGYSYDGLITELSTYAKADSVRLTFPGGNHCHCYCPENGGSRSVYCRGVSGRSQHRRFQRVHLLAVCPGRCPQSLYEV